MRVGIAADHGGFAVKEEPAAALRDHGHQVVDFGAPSLDPADDFPDYVAPLARAVAAGEVERGLAVCGSGVGAGVRGGTVRAYFAPGKSGPDLVFLGLGDNGHTASLFPYSSALAEQERWVAEVFVDAAAGAGTTAAGEDLWRVSLTAPFLNTAATVVFLATGFAKAQVIQDVIEGAYDPERFPAQLIRPAPGDLRWYLDEAAAALLR